MDAREIFDAYFNFFVEQERTAFLDYTNSTLWTRRATKALVHVGIKAFTSELKDRIPEVSAKEHADNPYGRSEYFTLDVSITDPNTWKSPLFIAEHENSGSLERVQYDAWKLLSVDAKHRVLVAYFGGTCRAKDFAALRQAVLEVCADHSGKDILLIGGQADARPDDAATFRSVHETAIVGAPRRMT